jgi:Double-stranded RNA binding motif
MQAAAPRAWTAFELVQRLDGVVTPTRLAQAVAVLQEDPRFSPDRSRADAYRDAYRLTQAQAARDAAQEAARAAAREEKAKATRTRALEQVQASMRTLLADTCGRDGAKSLLSEVVQVMRWPFPRYHVTHDGPPHARMFCGTVTLDIAGTEVSATGEGTARTKKAAE